MKEVDVIYVDENDNEIGSGPIQKAYDEGIVRRIVRIVVRNKNGDILVQKRGNTPSYPFKWNESTTGHVDVGETYEEAALREMKEEVGIVGVEVEPVGKFFFVEDTESDRKFNMVFSALYDGEVIIDPKEVSECKWVSLEDLKHWIKKSPEEFTSGALEGFGFFFEKLKL